VIRVSVPFRLRDRGSWILNPHVASLRQQPFPDQPIMVSARYPVTVSAPFVVAAASIAGANLTAVHPGLIPIVPT